MDILIFEYIMEYLIDVVNNKTCCMFFLGPFFNLGKQVNSEIERIGLRIQDHIINGRKVKRVYNSHCCHCIDVQRPFHLSEQSQKDILYHVQNYNYNGYNQDALPTFLYKPNRLVPVLPVNRFTIVPLRQNTFHSDAMRREFVPKSWLLYPFKKGILKKMQQNQMLVINGDASLNKSTSIPLLILEESIAEETYCKILCVESDNLMAITHSTFMAEHLNERIGSRVGFQVHLQSRVCDNTNIIFTAAVFFLRVLMGKGAIDSFRYISHVVLSDVHLHHPFKDIFLYELKKISVHYPHIKIILLSDSTENTNLLSYFGKGQELCLNIKLNKLNVYHIEEIIELLQNQSQIRTSVNNISLIVPNIERDTDIADNALKHYNELGNDIALNNFLYFVKCDKISINHIHSKDGYSALTAAVKHENPLHVKWILSFETANPLQQDKFKINAFEYAISMNSFECIRVLSEIMRSTKYEPKPPPIDFELICKLIHVISNRWVYGNILIFLPIYEDLLKLKHKILKLQFLGKIQQEICIHLLHSNLQPEQLQQLSQNQGMGKLILATELAESFPYLNDITYVIDCGQILKEKYRPEFKCIESSNEWISQESLQKRSLIASRFTDGHCFRLMSRKILIQLPSMSPPELHYIPLNKICLTVKLLSPDVSVTQYFENTITQPPPEHVADSIKFLKDIEALDTNLEVTWLGCRLIDVPINIELGKALVVSILLKCLDPVLTIISFLTCVNSPKLFKHQNATDCDTKCDPFLSHDNSFSDHLKFLRIYQNWQDEKKSKIASDVISDEETFILNGILENVCDIRTSLVGALRSSQLIHNQGLLSMHSINAKANNWAIIKAALVGGLYPKVCMINPLDNSIKSKTSELCIAESSVMHPSLRKVKSSPLSDWVVYFSETNNFSCTVISNCTLISPATVALFVGKMDMDPKNIFFTKDRVGFFIDEHIWLVTDSRSALLTFALRQRFYAAFLDYLATCANIEKWRNLNNMPYVFDVISKILLEEDKNAGFRQPTNVGNRPKAITSKFTSGFELAKNSNKFCLLKNSVRPLTLSLNHGFLEKQFFLINKFDSHHSLKSFWNMPMMDLSEDAHFKFIADIVSEKKLLYVVVCSATKKRIINIALISCDDDGAFLLRNCFQVNIPLHDVIIRCAALKLSVPSMSPGCIPHKLDNAIGEIILELW